MSACSAGARDQRRQVAARRVAHQGDRSGVDAQLARVLGQPCVGGQAVLDGGGVGGLGGQAVVDRHDDGARAGGEHPAGSVMGVEVADHPPAAVEETDRRWARLEVGVAVEPHPQRSRRTGQVTLPGVHALRSSRPEDRRPNHVGPRGFDVAVVQRGNPVGQLQHRLHLGVEAPAVSDDLVAAPGDGAEQRAGDRCDGVQT